MEEHTAGEVVGERYEILAKIGQGGMGAVYRARDQKLKREVALKRVVLAGIDRQGTEELQARFRSEAEAIAKLGHPNIVQVYDSGVDSDGDWLVMELVPGGTLAEALAKRGRFPVADAVPLIRSVALGLASAHRQGIFHRDIKPANVLLALDGTPKIVDFGLAKTGGGSEVSQTGYGMGTQAYMPPEQRRDAKNVNQTADIYALGKTFYELLSGVSPPPGCPFHPRCHRVMPRCRTECPAMVVRGERSAACHLLGRAPGCSSGASGGAG